MQTSPPALNTKTQKACHAGEQSEVLVRDSSKSVCWKTKGSSEKSKFIAEECLIQTSYSFRTISMSHCCRSFLRIPSLACTTPCSAGGFLRVTGNVLLLPKLEEGVLAVI